jgi:predicted restriction endonuclease
MTLKQSLNLDGTRSSKYNTVRHHARKAALKFPQECSNCGYRLHVDVCHIKAIKDFHEETLISEINSLQNLTLLCKNHHWELDNGYPAAYIHLK